VNTTALAFMQMPRACTAQLAEASSHFLGVGCSQCSCWRAQTSHPGAGPHSRHTSTAVANTDLRSPVMCLDSLAPVAATAHHWAGSPATHACTPCSLSFNTTYTVSRRCTAAQAALLRMRSVFTCFQGTRSAAGLDPAEAGRSRCKWVAANVHAGFIAPAWMFVVPTLL
jgi:hypothetical protein